MNRREILTETQKAVLQMFAAQEDLTNTYVLSGGTALAAFHLQHRRSDDLDFFSIEPVDALRVRRFAEDVRKHLGASTLETHRLYDRHIFLCSARAEEILKMEFTQYPYQHLEVSHVHDGVRVESLRDIGADKLAALLDRFEPKDYYDLYVLLQQKRTTLEQLRKDVLEKFHVKADAVQLGAAFARSRQLPILPHMLDPVTKEQVQQFFDQLAKSLRSEVGEE